MQRTTFTPSNPAMTALPAVVATGLCGCHARLRQRGAARRAAQRRSANRLLCAHTCCWGARSTQQGAGFTADTQVTRSQRCTGPLAHQLGAQGAATAGLFAPALSAVRNFARQQVSVGAPGGCKRAFSTTNTCTASVCVLQHMRRAVKHWWHCASWCAPLHPAAAAAIHDAMPCELPLPSCPASQALLPAGWLR